MIKHRRVRAFYNNTTLVFVMDDILDPLVQSETMKPVFSEKFVEFLVMT